MARPIHITGVDTPVAALANRLAAPVVAIETPGELAKKHLKTASALGARALRATVRGAAHMGRQTGRFARDNRMALTAGMAGIGMVGAVLTAVKAGFDVNAYGTFKSFFDVFAEKPVTQQITETSFTGTVTAGGGLGALGVASLGANLIMGHGKRYRTDEAEADARTAHRVLDLVHGDTRAAANLRTPYSARRPQGWQYRSTADHQAKANAHRVRTVVLTAIAGRMARQTLLSEIHDTYDTQNLYPRSTTTTYQAASYTEHLPQHTPRAISEGNGLYNTYSDQITDDSSTIDLAAATANIIMGAEQHLRERTGELPLISVT